MPSELSAKPPMPTLSGTGRRNGILVRMPTWVKITLASLAFACLMAFHSRKKVERTLGR
jgi:hypothetical protein